MPNPTVRAKARTLPKAIQSTPPREVADRRGLRAYFRGPARHHTGRVIGVPRLRPRSGARGLARRMRQIRRSREALRRDVPQSSRADARSVCGPFKAAGRNL
jgi:hypothetical protein